MTSTTERLERWLAPRHTAYVVSGGALGLAGSLLTLVLASAGGALLVVGVGVLVLWLLLVVSDLLSRAHRARVHALLGVWIEPALPEPDGWSQRIRSLARATTWRQLGYHALWGMVACFLALGLVYWYAAGLALVTAFAWGGVGGASPAGLLQPTGPGGRALATAAGLGVLAVGPSLARGLAWVDLAVARPALGATRAEVLRPRVASLEVSRAGVIDAADAERRRIERDLHDGAQQRLTSLAMNLGMARSALAADAPPETRAAIEEAHDEAKQALAELRGFVRGLHPAVLDARGLDAALSGIVARSPVPATLEVSLPVRPSPTVEAVAYFVVSEALTNIARHSGARSAAVSVVGSGDQVVVEVADDGHGGAQPGGGSGLTGLASRVAAVDGTLSVSSPAGGPTVLRAVLPCAS